MSLSSQLNELKRKVDFNTYDISVRELVTMFKDGLIDIAPEYQRQFRWKEDRQSALIESIFLGIPVPSLYMATNNDGRWELIDGVQRLSTLVHFAGSKQARSRVGLKTALKLKGLDKLSLFNGLMLDELPTQIKIEFQLRSVKITTLSDKSDLNVRFDLFERLNTGGVVLTNQEIRSCVYRGEFNKFLGKLANDSNFRKVVKVNQAQISDGTREEFVLRFFSFLNNYKAFDHSVVGFLNEYMESSNKQFDYDINEQIFRETFKQLAKLPNGITRGRTTTPTNLFEGVSVGAALAINESGKINIVKADDWISSNELKSYTTGATNSKSKVIQRIEFCRDKFLSK